MFTDSIDIANSEYVDEVIKRLYEAFNVSSDRSLSMKLGLSHSRIAMSRKSGALPVSSIVQTCINEKVSLDHIFGVKKYLNNAEPVAHNNSTYEEAAAACKLVEKVIDELFENKNIDSDKELLIRKKLQPLLLQKVFELNFNEIMVKTVAEGALFMV